MRVSIGLHTMNRGSFGYKQSIFKHLCYIIPNSCVHFGIEPLTNHHADLCIFTPSITLIGWLLCVPRVVLCMTPQKPEVKYWIKRPKYERFMDWILQKAVFLHYGLPLIEPELRNKESLHPLGTASIPFNESNPDTSFKVQGLECAIVILRVYRERQAKQNRLSQKLWWGCSRSPWRANNEFARGSHWKVFVVPFRVLFDDQVMEVPSMKPSWNCSIHTWFWQVDALSKLIEVIVGLKITGSATEMPMPLENDVFSRCSSHATRCQYHCRWPKTASWTFEACCFFTSAACHKRTTFSTFRSNTESLLLVSKEELKGTHSTTGNNWICQSLPPYRWGSL